MKHNPKSPFNTFEECPDCGSLWRVMKDGRIDFAPRGPAMHHVCAKCMQSTLDKYHEITKSSPAKKAAPKKKVAPKKVADD